MEIRTIEIEGRGPQIIGIFTDSIFDVYPSKATEIIDALIILIRKSPVLLKGIFQFKVSNSVASLSYEGGHALSHCDGSRNSYGVAIEFLKDENVLNYIANLKN